MKKLGLVLLMSFIIGLAVISAAMMWYDFQDEDLQGMLMHAIMIIIYINPISEIFYKLKTMER